MCAVYLYALNIDYLLGLYVETKMDDLKQKPQIRAYNFDWTGETGVDYLTFCWIGCVRVTSSLKDAPIQNLTIYKVEMYTHSKTHMNI